MPLTQPTEENSIIIKLALWIAGGFLSFLGGVITTTWMIASKVKSFDDRIKSVELTQVKCQSETLANIAEKLDILPDMIDEKMEDKFGRVHARIDTLIMSGQSHAEASARRDKLTLKTIEGE